MQWTSAPNIGEAPLPQRARGYWKTRFSALHDQAERLLEREHAQLPPWFVVGFGSGIAAWFALGSPLEWRLFLAASLLLAAAGVTVRGGRAGRALAWFALAAALGCALVWMRAVLVAQPTLERSLVTQVGGTVETVEHLAARDKVRLLVHPDDARLPPHVRISIEEAKFPAGIAPGSRIAVHVRLAPPPPMALPGTYDFARDAWFQGIGAVGKALGDIAVSKPAHPRGLERVRESLRQQISSRLPQSSAGIAIALATGDQNAVDQDDADAMRRTA